MSVSKPFVFALVCDALGADRARELLGVNATGLPFNSLEAVERSGDGRTNPMVNPGAIATTSLVPGATAERKWQAIHEGLSRFAGRDARARRGGLPVGVRRRTTATRRSPACSTGSAGSTATRPRRSTSTPGSARLDVTATDLAVMGATLADGGVNPLHRRAGRRARPSAATTLAVMATAGLYETSGDWLYDVGLPGKSGIGGGIVTVSPGKGGLGTFAPPLDDAGNSVKGQLAARFLSAALGLDLFASEPDGVTRRLVLVAARRGAARSPSLAAAPGRRRRAGAGRSATRPSCELVAQAHECGTGESYEPIDVDALFDEPTVALRGPVGPGDLVKIAPVGGRSHRGALRVPPRLPRQPARPGLRLRALGAPHHGGNDADRLRARRHATPDIPASSRSSTGSSTSSTTGTTRTRATGR